MSATDTDVVDLIVHEIQTSWSETTAEVFIYGAYLVMFAFYMHLFRTRDMAKTHRFLHISTIILFILGTAHCAIQLAMSVLLTRSFTAHFVLRHEEVIDAIGAAGNTVYITSNMIADSVFIFRCYSIWNRRLAIIVFPALLVLVAAGLGCAELMLLILYLSQRTTSALNTLNVVGLKLFITSITVSLLTTVVLMALTMGRIWSLARAARVVMGQKAAGTYYTVCAMILESGALYVVFGTGYVAIGFKLAMVGILPGVVLAQVVGIAPTIIAVRVGLGCSVEDVNSFVVPPRAAQRPFAAKMQTVSDESLGKHVLYIHATENEAAGQIG